MVPGENVMWCCLEETLDGAGKNVSRCLGKILDGSLKKPLMMFGGNVINEAWRNVRWCMEKTYGGAWRKHLVMPSENVKWCLEKTFGGGREAMRHGGNAWVGVSRGQNYKAAVG